MRVRLIVFLFVAIIILNGISKKFGQQENDKVLNLDFSKFVQASNREIKVTVVSVNIIGNTAVSQEQIDNAEKLLKTFVLVTTCPITTTQVAKKFGQYKFKAVETSIDLRYKFEFYGDGVQLVTFYADAHGRIQLRGQEEVYKQVSKGKIWLLDFWENIVNDLYNEKLLN